ncbi:MAG: LysM peptidoglycan-binding domain-containing protein [Phycisphaerales bacterium]|nr:MAG: LysM peptidoglycan-binding domain-containing protein [Phycisphaerales bacterium]
MRARIAKPPDTLPERPLPRVVDRSPTASDSPVEPDEIAPSAEHTSAPQQSPVIDSTVYEMDEKIKTRRFHIVLRGETLSAISVKYYGSANKWPKILDANRSRIADANRIIPGTKLTIPD